MNIVYYSPKGGSGVTVTAATAALVASADGTDVLLVSFTGDDIFATLGAPTPQDVGEVATIRGTLRAVQYDPAVLTADGFQLPYAETYIFDAPASAVGDIRLRWADVAALVTRPCYLALRRVMASPVRPDLAVLVLEPGRALGEDYVAAVLGVHVTAVSYDPAVARVVDAGLLASRFPYSPNTEGAQS